MQLKRDIMNKINISITKHNIEKDDKIADLFDDDILRLTFKNEEEYLKFISNPKLTIYDFNIIPEICSIEKVKTYLKKLNLTEALKDTKPVIEIKNKDDLPINLLKRKENIILNVTQLNIKETITIITNPIVSNNVSFYGKYDEGKLTTLKELLEVYNKLLNLIKPAIKNNYSPAESIYYIYNLVKQRIYNEEQKEEDYSKSRSITEVLNGDKIVCSGYSNLIAALANLIDIPVEVSYWEDSFDNLPGHTANIVYLNDPKYNICGIYAIDATWDSKKNQDDKEYKNNIKHFLLPMSIEEIDKKEQNLKPTIGCSYYSFLLFILEHKNNIIINNIKDRVLKKAYKIYEYLNLPKPKDNMINLKKEITLYGKRTINPKALKQIITTVTPMQDEDLEKTISTSFHQYFYEIKNLNNTLFKKKKRTKKIPTIM